MQAGKKTKRSLTQWPPPESTAVCVPGIYPIDFVFEAFLEDGFKWFRDDPKAPLLVYGHLLDAKLKDKYGQAKIDEIASFIRGREIDIKQSFPFEDEESPSISINLQSQQERIDRAGLADYADAMVGVDTLGNITSGVERGYVPMVSEVLLGIHATGSPDKAKFIYYLVVYILQAFKHQLEDREDKANGLFNLTFRASDLSRLNEYLPQHMFSRFVTVTVEHFDIFDQEHAPIVTSFDLNVDVEGG